MQATTLPVKTIVSNQALNEVFIQTGNETNTNKMMVYGMHHSFARFFIWLNVFAVAFYYFKNPFKAFNAFKNLKAIRAGARGRHRQMKYVKFNGRYYFTYTSPGFPSKAFNQYILNNIKRVDAGNQEPVLDTLIFAITKKCGYHCEHCFEWNILNQPEVLSRENILSVVKSFQQSGITQLQLSGGEPLNRFNDIVYLLQHIKRGTDVWIYTSGYHFTIGRAINLKKEGLAGVVVSLDHWVPEKHNAFRGKADAFYWAEKAVSNAIKSGLNVCLSLCATKEFVTRRNLESYLELAKTWGVGFIQVLEPKALGHYAGMDVALSDEQVKLLEDFLVEYNFSASKKHYPLIIYHGFYSRHLACAGGRHYVYVDTDGNVHNCPFCKHKKFSALNDDIRENLKKMKMDQCSVFENPVIKKWMQ